MNYCNGTTHTFNGARAKNPNGFTLIEVLVAMAIMALIGIGAFSLLNTATVAGDKIKREGKRLNEIQRAFLLISNDLQQVTGRIMQDEYGEPMPALTNDLPYPKYLLRFSRLGRRNPAMLPRSSIEHLLYSLENNKLIRITFPYLDGMRDDQGLKRPILSDVDNVEMTFFHKKKWHKKWPIPTPYASKPPPAIPEAIKISLELIDYGIVERIYVIPSA